MKKGYVPVAAVVAVALLPGAVWSAEGGQEPLIEEMSVYGEQQETNTATRLDLSIFETPQTVTAVSLQQIQDFALDDINELLRYTPGVTVEYVETDRIYYTARGFDIVNFQYDGIGVPFSAGLSHGHQDTAIFEKVEVVKGAAGLITGLANPSATVNFVRKRPTEDLAGSLTLLAGEENRFRVQGDVSGSLSSSVRGRIVVAQDNADSYLDRRETDDRVYYGVLEFDLSDATTLTVGHSMNRNNSDGSMSGGLPLYYTDGSQTDYGVSTSTATDWAFRDVDREQTFAELEYRFNENWALKALLTYNKIDMDAEELYVYGTPDRVTELGLLGYAFGYELDEEQTIADVFVSGTYSLAGRSHELVFGVNYADIDVHGQSFYDYTNGFPVLGSDWAKGSTPHPNFVDTDPYTAAHQNDQEHKSIYFATRLNLTDELSVLLGARKMDVDESGFNYGTDVDSSADETVPYVGLTYNLTDTLILYGSYSEVFTPQAFVTSSFEALGVAEGDSREVGLKFSLNDRKATGSIGFFQSNLKNLGEFDSVVSGINTYNSLDFETKGLELELIGSVTDNLNLSFGYTYLDEVVGDDGKDVRTYIPRKTLKLAVAYDVEQLEGFTVGAGLTWQDDIYIEPAAGVRVEQDSYALVNAFARYDVSESLSVALNVDNLTDKKYINSLYWTQGFHGSPRQAQVSVTWRF